MENRESPSRAKLPGEGFCGDWKEMLQRSHHATDLMQEIWAWDGGIRKNASGAGRDRKRRERECVNHDGTDFIGCQICSMNIYDSGDNGNLPHGPLVLTWCWH